jgi:hypothetical protein
MQEIIDPTTPRAQLSFEQLPRGFVPWPKVIRDALDHEQQRKGFPFAADYVQRHLERATLRYFYDGLDVAYRAVEGGIQVLGVSWQEASAYVNDPTVKVVQA